MDFRGGFLGPVGVGCAFAVCVVLLYALYSGIQGVLLSEGRLGASGVAVSCGPQAQVRFLSVSGFLCVICRWAIGDIICHVFSGVRLYLFCINLFFAGYWISGFKLYRVDMVVF